MNEKKIKKFENEERLKELSPIETLKRAGFKDEMVLCDIGAGTGVFAIPAAEMSTNKIYALEKSSDMIKILNERIIEKDLKNLRVEKVESDIFPIKDNICDFLILITVLHHIEDKKTMIGEIRRMSKEKGRLLVIEFHKRETKMGPPIEIRISQKELREFAEEYSLKILNNFELGDNFYGYLFEL